MTEEELEKFKASLLGAMTFPSVYMFKLIVPSENRTIALVENLFEEDADIHTLQSGKGTYTSITVKQVVMTVEEILGVYKKASEIKGVIFL